MKCLNNVHLFSEDVAEIETKMTQRGRNEATTYFLVPRELRKNLERINKVMILYFIEELKFIGLFLFVTLLFTL